MILYILDKYKFFVKTNYLVSSLAGIGTVFELILLECIFAQQVCSLLKVTVLIIIAIINKIFLHYEPLN